MPGGVKSFTSHHNSSRAAFSFPEQIGNVPRFRDSCLIAKSELIHWLKEWALGPVGPGLQLKYL